MPNQQTFESILIWAFVMYVRHECMVVRNICVLGMLARITVGYDSLRTNDQQDAEDTLHR